MLSSRHLRQAGVAVAVTFAAAGCATAPREPANLSPHKRELRAYVENGDYLRSIGVVADRAKAWVIERAASGGSQLTVVMDLDETLFFNWPLISAMDFGYVPAEWERWVGEARAPAIAPMRDVYRVARSAGVQVVFLTARPEDQRDATERNLRAIDCDDYAALICMPEGDTRTSAAFKAAAREQLTRDGRTIIANIGDQTSDLSGGWSERVFKVPNAFYLSD